MPRWLERAGATRTVRDLRGRLRSLAEGIARSGLFDEAFYRSQLADDARARAPARDYLERGAREGLDPHPLFDTSWYLERYPEVDREGTNPLVHFLLCGGGTACRPNPLFETTWYLGRYPEVRFAGEVPLLHYLTGGEERGFRPNPLFDPIWYRARHPEITSGESALAHYLSVGGPRGDPPCPLFDPSWYSRRLPGGLPRGARALEHYLSLGSQQGVDPHPLFDAAWYLSQHPEATRSGLDPLAHFLEHGARAGCAPHPLFDSAWYLERYPDVARSGANPLEHFVERGAAEERQPHPLFDTAWYRARYPAVRRSRSNPLVFFLETGAARAHAPNPLFHPAWYRARHPELGASWLEATLHFATHRGEQGTEPNPLLPCYAAFFAASDDAPQLADPTQNPLAALLGPQGPAAVPIRLPAVAEAEASIIIPTYDRASYTIPCLRSVAAARTRIPFEVILIDDASPSLDYRRQLAHVENLRVLRNPHNLGFVESCNRAATEALGSYLVFLNNDTIVMDDWLDELIATFEKFPRAGIAGSKLLYPSGATGEAGGIVWRDGSAWNYGRRHGPDSPEVGYARPADYVSGAALAIERRLFHELGGFAAEFAPAYYEDTDLAFRVRQAGRQVIYQPASEVIHFEGVSSGGVLEGGMKAHQARNHEVFFARWRTAIEGWGEPGVDPDRAKDRHYAGRALVFDTVTPTPGRDARSLRTLQLMRILLDLGLKVTFAPANGNAPDPWRRSLQSHGIQVLHRPWIESVEGFLANTLDHFDLCVVSRPALAQRLVAPLRARFPGALCLFDAADLLPAESVWRRRTAASGPPPAEGAAAHATLVAVEPAKGRPSQQEERERGVYLLPWIYQEPRRRVGFAPRRDLLFIAGLQSAPGLDALLWMVEEILPRLLREIGDARIWVPKRASLLGVEVLEPRIANLSDADLEDPRSLDRFRVAVAPFRFGPSVHGQLQPALARGLPCVATACAVQALPPALRSCVTLVERADDLAESIARLYREPEVWHAASESSRAAVASIYSFDSARARVRRILADHGWTPGDAGTAGTGHR